VAYKANSTYFLHAKESAFPMMPSKTDMMCPLELDLNIGALEQPGLHISTGMPLPSQTRSKERGASDASSDAARKLIFVPTLKVRVAP
jgi:hypothetical protein